MNKARLGFAMGLLSLVAWLVPVIGVPVALIGFSKSRAGLELEDSPSRRRVAVAGLVLSTVGLTLSLVNALAAAYMAW